MEFTQETLDSLAVSETEVMKRVAGELNVRAQQVGAVVALVSEGCTIPFISRYRKEQHGSLDEVQVRDADRLFKSYTNLETRRLEIARGIFAAGKLTESLYGAVMGAKTLAELEDLWAPFKRKKKTRGMTAGEKGLEPLADAMLELGDAAIEVKAAEFVREDAERPELSVASAADALQGAQDILAERCAQDTENRACVRAFYMRTSAIKAKGIGGESAAKTSVYQMYWDYAEPLSQIKPHRVLAVNRGEREGALDVDVDVDVDGAIDLLKKRYTINNKYHAEAIADGLARLLSPAVVREIRSDQTDGADEHGIGIFSENLKNLLMQQPIKGTRVLGVDPGIRTGTKCAALDETGKYLGYFVVNQQTRPAEAEAAIQKAVADYGIQLVAVGNGTGTREVQEIVSRVIAAHFPGVLYTVVDEDGASVYSASDAAREEFPDLDLTIRGAISIGRRLQDPLAELVKIDPKSIGVGLYQHDVNQKKLSEMLDEVVGSVVNRVGVNLNTASHSLLRYVSGINSGLAKKIVAYRNENGAITSREDLKKVGGMGEKTFEQCAGFLKIPESADPLDKTWVHPENYAAAREVLPLVQQKNGVPALLKEQLREKYGIGRQTVDDIIGELQKPSRDPRDTYPKPIMQQGVVSFEDLKEGMKVTGKVKNVVDFGAFVDLGVKETALLHISEMSDSFVADSLGVLKAGDVKEFTIIGLDSDRRRISLSLKSATARRGGQNTVMRGRASGDGGVGAPDGCRAAGSARTGGERRPRPSGSDDGTHYSPFAELLKNRS
ncbi:helix-hairpin-helix domain-containing protein [Treponema endosymbiont of Eucomonympha sp.]|uniref:helix-hairpin-helix domain-containing protein n=4 Tax=Treponema endosymbiont of Eucomonympha sp. TaxID=1580831 RepID=UPI000750D81A|nr:Tex family protein [Treponema endosymbiont of Eucomonympha sp.]